MAVVGLAGICGFRNKVWRRIREAASRAALQGPYHVVRLGEGDNVIIWPPNLLRKVGLLGGEKSLIQYKTALHPQYLLFLPE